jgi:gluconokinase
MADPCVVGIDLGTTSVKAIAFDRTGRPLADASGQVTTDASDAQRAEQDPLAVLAAATAALTQVALAAHAHGYAPTLVGCSAAMHSLIALDEHDQPLTNAIIWMDRRAEDAADGLWSSPQGPALYARTGTPIHAMTPLAKLLWLRTAQPELFARARHFVSLKEWVWHAWFNEWRVDVSMANATGLYNLRTATWDEEALALTGITPAHLSPLVPVTYAARGPNIPALVDAGLANEMTCVIGSTDGVLANLAANALDAATMVLTIGTSCALRVGSAMPVTNADLRSFCYALDPHHFILGAPSNSGGVVLEWAHRTLATAEAPIAHALEQAADAWDDDLLMLPYLAGERAPLWDASASGAWIGLRAHHTPAHLLRAAVEGIIFNAYRIAEGLFTLVGTPQRLIATGKVLSPLWVQQVVAETFALPVEVDTATDASVLGAAKLAQIATGALAWDASWGITQTRPLRQPTDAARYRAKYQRFRAISAKISG